MLPALTQLAAASAFCAALPAALAIFNRFEYKRPPLPPPGAKLNLTVIIPARNEETGIVDCLSAVLASTHVLLQVIVVDDHSTDDTAARVFSIADSRVHLLSAPLLPAGWNGKQHACWFGAQNAAAPILCFLDADVRLHPEALSRMATLLTRQRAALVSGFPLQITGTPMEQLLIPLIQFVLMGLLPMRFVRTTSLPGFSAGCGQFLMADRNAYFATGGHSSIRETMHDGVRLPLLFRKAGLATRLADLRPFATCRMYHSAAQVWQGLLKNATEGFAAPRRIVPITLLLGLGQVLPVPLLLAGALTGNHAAVVLSAVALLLSYAARLLAGAGALPAAHPVGVLLMLVLQWHALIRKLRGRPVAWKQRTYSPQETTPEETSA